MAGFDAIGNHIGLIIFPIALDIFLWFGPHLRLTRFIEALLGQFLAQPEMTTPEMSEMVRTSREIWLLAAERFNLASVLRSYPVGIPSLMISRLPVETPLGFPLAWEVPSAGAAIGLWIGMTLFGLVIGTLYFGFVSQVTLSGKMDVRKAFGQWPRAALQVISLAIFCLALLIGVSIPFSCFFTLLFLSGIGVSRFAFLLLASLFVWLLLMLVFTPHGIFAKQSSMWVSISEGVLLARKTFPTTGFFILVILILSEGLDILWKIPAETSWLAIVAIAGHAFVTTALLAATFVYYRDATRWIQRLQQQAAMAS